MENLTQQGAIKEINAIVNSEKPTWKFWISGSQTRLFSKNYLEKQNTEIVEP